MSVTDFRKPAVVVPVLAAALLFMSAATVNAQAQSSRAVRSYLLSLSFSVPPLAEWTDTTVRAAAATPYDGVAAMIASAYAKGPAPAAGDFAGPVALIKSDGYGKSVWPWVFLNRIVSPPRPKAKREADKEFAGVDLDGSGGTLQPFYATWRTALHVAKELGAPGIFFDTEPYSDHHLYWLDTLAVMRGVDRQTVKAQARSIGVQLADIAAQEYPDVVILTLLTQYARPRPATRLLPTILDGLMQEASDKNIPLKLVDGGEPVGYCALDLADLQKRHAMRLDRLRPVMQRFPRIFVPGATLGPWLDAGRRTGAYLRRRLCSGSQLRTIGDFQPLLVWLMRQYPYVWIYGARAAGYAPLDPGDRKVIDPVLTTSRQTAARLGPLSLPGGNQP